MWYDEENHDSRWHERLGLVLQKASQHASALEEFRKAIENDGTNLEAVCWATDCLAELDNVEASAAICKFVLSKWPVAIGTGDRNEWRSGLARFSNSLFVFAQAIESAGEIFDQVPNGENFQRRMKRRMCQRIGLVSLIRCPWTLLLSNNAKMLWTNVSSKSSYGLWST